MERGAIIRARTSIAVLLAGLLASSGFAAVDVERPFDNSRLVSIDGVKLHLREWPAVPALPVSPDAVAWRCPVLLVHALAGSTYSFRHIAPALSGAGHRVLAIDMPGYGYSERRAFDGSASRALWALLAREAPGERWCLVGHSMGARIVGHMAADAPSAAAAVAYLSGSPVRARRRNPSMFRAQPLRGVVLAVAERRYLNAAGFAKALEDGLGQPPQPGDVDAYLAPLMLPGTLPAILDGYARDMGEDRTDPAAIAGVPSLVVWGGRDRWLKPQVGRDLAGALPGARWLQIDDAAHSPMETHPELVVPALLGFFAAADPGEDDAGSPRISAVNPAASGPSSP